MVLKIEKFVFFPPRAEFRIGILIIFANHSAGTEWICTAVISWRLTVETRRATSLQQNGNNAINL